MFTCRQLNALDWDYFTDIIMPLSFNYHIVLVLILTASYAISSRWLVSIVMGGRMEEQ